MSYEILVENDCNLTVNPGDIVSVKYRRKESFMSTNKSWSEIARYTIKKETKFNRVAIVKFEDEFGMHFGIAGVLGCNDEL